MARFTRGLVVTLVVLVLGSFVVMLQQKPASGAPGSAPVTVTNTPLPVNVGNFPATQNVNGTVTASISGTPTVNANISNSLSALITNPTTNPVLVSNINDSFDHEFNVPLCENGQNEPLPPCPPPNQTNGNEVISVFSIPSTTFFGNFTVTAAVIEFVTGWCEANPSNDITTVSLNTPGPTGRTYFLVPVKTTPSNGLSNWAISQTTKIYAYPGTSIAFVASTAGGIDTSGQECNAQVAGTFLTQ